MTGVRLEPEGLFRKDRSSPSLLYGPFRGLHLFSDNDCGAPWSISNKPRRAPQQQTLRLHPDHTDGEQELQPDKRESFSSLPEPASAKLLSADEVHRVRPSQPSQLHVPDRRERLLQRNKLQPYRIVYYIQSQHCR